MTVRVNLPPGCEGLNMQDGKRYTAASAGGHVDVEDRHAAAIDRLSTGGDAGLVSGGRFRSFIGTRRGRWCPACSRVWNAWSHECPRCGADTVEDDA